MTKSREQRLDEMLDRQDIYECMTRYCRGVDRGDAELLRSAYHADGIDDHGGYVGPRDGYVEWGMNVVHNFFEVSLHYITNFSCEVDGNRAHAEFYFLAMEKPQGLEREIRGGRYVQQYEKRNGKWGIIESVCMLDCDQPNLDPANTEVGINAERFIQQKKNHSDPSYMRPLRVDRSRFTEQGKEAARKIAE